MSEITLYNADCLDIFPEIPDNSVDMVLCDLPYGKTKCRWDIQIPLKPLWNAYKRIVKPDGAIVLFGIEPFSSMLRLSNIAYYKYDWIWDKVQGTGFYNAKRQPLRYHEYLHVFYKKQCTYNPQMTHGHERKMSCKKKEKNTDVYGVNTKDNIYDSTDRYPRSIQVFPKDTQKLSIHPTQKPVGLCEYMIKTYTNEGETVFDNAMGSGTVGDACINTNRNFIGIEKYQEIFDKAFWRISKNSQIVNTVKNELIAEFITA